MKGPYSSSRTRRGWFRGLLSTPDGYALAVVIILALVSAVMVAAFMGMTMTEYKIVDSNSDTIASFHIAEAGLEKGKRLLYEDVKNTPEDVVPSWDDGKFYLDSYGGEYMAEGVITYYPNFRTLVATTEFGGGTYTVEIANISGRDDAVWVRSTGTYLGKARAVMAKLRIKNLNPWNNAIFAGAGAAGKAINGNVDIRGSVHILGEDTFHGTVMEMSGGAYVGNNYIGLPGALASRIPMIAEMDGTRLFETLDAEVRVRYGQVSISGTAGLGGSGTTEITYDAQVGDAKMPVDGTYVTDGWTGTAGASAVYSDNGTDEPYDIPNDTFDGLPKITEPYEGYASYMDYLRDNALVISDPAALSELANITRSSSFSYSSANGSISADGAGNLTISGIVVIEGDFNIGKDNSGPIYYQGSAGVLATGSSTFENDLLVGSGETFPTTSILGLMTPNTITFNRSQLSIQGIFYAENQITSMKQTIVTGSFFSNYFDMGQNVPNIFQVPSVVENLPPGMFGGINVYSIRQDCFREVDVGGTQ